MDSNLKQFATARQLELINAIEEEGTIAQAAKKMGITSRNAHYLVQRLKRTAVQRGYSPEHDLKHPLPIGMELKGASTLYNKEGELVLQWVKSKQSRLEIETVVRAMVDGLMSGVKYRPSKSKEPKHRSDEDLLSAYMIGDAHIGMYAWGDEAGDDFDLTIAEEHLRKAIDRMVMVAPNSKECLIAQLGDFLHMDDSSNATPANKNALDVDSRYLKVVKTAIRILIYMVEVALSKHEVVRVRNAAGNHDPHSSVALTLALAAYYHGNNRVIVEESPAPFWHMTFGDNLIGIAHGDAPKPEKLAQVLAVEAKGDWGKEFKYIWHGHFHHKRVIEEMHCIIEGFRTLAARDAWHASEGYGAGREMQCIVLHKEYGEIERYTANLRAIG